MDGGVNGHSFCKPPHVGIGGIDVVQASFSAQKRYNLSGFPGRGNGGVDVGLDPGVPLKVVINVCLCHFSADFQLFSQLKCPHAIHNAKINSLGLATQFRSDKSR